MKVNKKSSDFTSFDISATKEAQEINNAIDEVTSTKYDVVNIPIEDIEFNPKNTRFSNIDTDEEIAELATSIELYGLIHPVAVFPHGDKYMLFSGERRTRAYIMLGRRTIPAMVYPDTGDLGNMEKLYTTNLQSRILDIRTRFLAYKDLRAEYENESKTVKSADIAKKLQLSSSSEKKFKLLYQNAEDGDIELLQSGDMTWEEFYRHTLDVVAARENNSYKKRIEIISRNTEKVEPTNYSDAEGSTVYSVERDKNDMFCIAVTNVTLFKVPMHDYRRNQVFSEFREAQIALNFFAAANKLKIYAGDFSEFMKKASSPLPVAETPTVEKTSSSNDDGESNAIDETQYGPSITDTYPTMPVGNVDDEEDYDADDTSDTDSVDMTEIADEPVVVDTPDEDETDASEDKAVKTDVEVKTPVSEDVEDKPVKVETSAGDYLKQFATFSGQSIENGRVYHGSLYYKGTRAFIIFDLAFASAEITGQATRKTSAQFVEVDPKTVMIRYEA